MPRVAILMLVMLCAGARPAMASDATITLQHHIFNPEIIQIPANRQVRLIIVNRDMAAEKFVSSELEREILIPPNSAVSIAIGPLRHGVYMFFGAFHPKTAQGKIFVQ